MLAFYCLVYWVHLFCKSVLQCWVRKQGSIIIEYSPMTYIAPPFFILRYYFEEHQYKFHSMINRLILIFREIFLLFYFVAFPWSRKQVYIILCFISSLQGVWPTRRKSSPTSLIPQASLWVSLSVACQSGEYSGGCLLEL